MGRDVLGSPLPHVGSLLRFMRESRGMSTEVLIARLGRCGYVISVATYVNLEAGHLVDDAEAFIDAYSEVLRLTRPELSAVATQWARDLLRARMGDEYARTFFR